MAPPANPDALSPVELRALVSALQGKVVDLERTVAAQREEIARLKGLKARPRIKPSGMEQAGEPKPPRGPHGRRGRGKVVPRVAVEDRVVAACVPPGSRLFWFGTARTETGSTLDTVWALKPEIFQ